MHLNTDIQSVPQHSNPKMKDDNIEDEEEFKKLLQINQSIDSLPFQYTTSQTTNQKSNKHSTWMFQMVAKNEHQRNNNGLYTMTVIYLTYNIS